MKKNSLVTALLAAGLALGAAASHAEGLRLLPGQEKGFKYEPTIAVTGGVTSVPSINDDSVAQYGIDLNMNCGLLQTPDNRIRTHVQFNHYLDSDAKFVSFEVSPRYTIPLGAGFSVGAGPMVGAIRTNLVNNIQLAYGAVVGANYRMGMAYVGLDVRYMNTTTNNGYAFENTAILGKVGINF